MNIKNQLVNKIKDFDHNIELWKQGHLSKWDFDQNINVKGTKYSIFNDLSPVTGNSLVTSLFYLNKYVKNELTIRFLVHEPSRTFFYKNAKIYITSFIYKPKELTNKAVFTISNTQWYTPFFENRIDYTILIDEKLFNMYNLRIVIIKLLSVRKILSNNIHDLAYALFFDLLNENVNYPNLSLLLNSLFDELENFNPVQNQVLPFVFNHYNPTGTKVLNIELLKELFGKLQLKLNLKYAKITRDNPRNFTNNYLTVPSVHLALMNLVKYLDNVCITEYYYDFSNKLIEPELYREIYFQNQHIL